MFKRFEKNEIGRDFVIGDIHGCFDSVRAILADPGVQFDDSKDRLFSVGDLVDRGPHSIEAIEWIAKPWFHAVRGNHEQMAIGVAAGRHDLGNYLVNGGGWFLSLDESRQQLVASILDSLPICIEVDTGDGLVGIVHADIAGNDWKFFTSLLADSSLSNNRKKAVLEYALWCRDRIQGRRDGDVEGLFCMYVGHTPVKQSVSLGNVVYIDTGAVFGRSITLACIQGYGAGQVVSLAC